MMENATLTYTHFFTPIFHTQTWQHLHHTFYYFIFTKDALTLTEERKKKNAEKKEKTRRDRWRSGRLEKRVPDTGSGVGAGFRRERRAREGWIERREWAASAPSSGLGVWVGFHRERGAWEGRI